VAGEEHFGVKLRDSDWLLRSFTWVELTAARPSIQLAIAGW
jgi:hypothetical protein